ncbi:hypothetical protein GCM10023187_43830 [Nibrella viscosa]|uniref:Outer membrane efflux protein n=1 Tax=Nibrella viscosa TaxID=1084524 RepID=A0ABP8KSQ5_9BACT
MAALRQATTTSSDLFASSYATYLEVITAQRNVLDAELSLINTKQAWFQTLIDLCRVLEVVGNSRLFAYLSPPECCCRP